MIPQETKYKYQGYLDGKLVRPALHRAKRTLYDGKKLDRLEISDNLYSQQDVQDLIDFLQVQKYCFENLVA